MHRSALIFLALLAVGCAPIQPRTDTPMRDPMTLCIENATAGYGNVIAYARAVRFEVMPGRTVCKELKEFASTVPLRASTVGGGAAGRLSFSASVEPRHGNCWQWTLSNSRASSFNVLPCDPGAANEDTQDTETNDP